MRVENRIELDETESRSAREAVKSVVLYKIAERRALVSSNNSVLVARGERGKRTSAGGGQVGN